MNVFLHKSTDIIYHHYEQILVSSGHPSTVAQPGSWVGPWEDAPDTDGAVVDGSEESG